MCEPDAIVPEKELYRIEDEQYIEKQPKELKNNE